MERLPNNLGELNSKVEENKKAIQNGYENELTYKICFRHLENTQGYYIAGFSTFKIQALPKPFSKSYKIIMINWDTLSMIQVIVDYDFRTERSQVASITPFLRKELETVIDSEVIGCEKERVKGECVQCQSGFEGNLDGNCYQKAKGC